MKPKRDDYIVYALLDPRKPGKFVYGELEFDFEPFYIGKGSKERPFYHILEQEDKKGANKRKVRRIKNILDAGHANYEVKLISDSLMEEIAFELEIKAISSIGRLDLNTGPLANLTNGGEGTSGIIRPFKVRVSEEEFRERLFNIHNGEIELIGEYVKIRKPALFRCKQGHEFWSTPNQIQMGGGCRKCSYVKRGLNSRTAHSEYVIKLAEATNDGYTSLEPIKGIGVKFLHQCNTCFHKWEVVPHSLLTKGGKGCPECYKKSISRDTRKKQYEDRIKDLHNSNIILIGDWTTQNNKSLHKCMDCGNEWMVLPSGILRGYGCPKCANVKKRNRRK